MKILHYSLGFPPYRTGGMTKFCMDVMQQQIALGHEVALLWPGRKRLLDKSVRIKERKKHTGIRSFEIINPLPVSFDEGIVEVDFFLQKCNKAVWQHFLEYYTPDVIHVHCLMGLHNEFLEVAKKYQIRLVFSIHDYFAICPKVTMFRNGQVCDCAVDCTLCPECNKTALSMKKIYVLQHPLYRILKDNWLVKKLRKRHRDNYLGNQITTSEPLSKSKEKVDKYLELRNYYRDALLKFDAVHANSSISYQVYQQFFDMKDCKVISISHSDISDHKKLKTFDRGMLRITYMGPASEAKGYFLLKEALDQLWIQKKDFLLNVYFESNDPSPYMVLHEKYQYSDLEKIFDNTDVLVAPSIWNETFGFTVLEALSYGVPVIVSNHVGASDIIKPNCGLVIKDMDSKKLKETISNLTVDMLRDMNCNIVNNVQIVDVKMMTDDIMNACYIHRPN